MNGVGPGKSLVVGEEEDRGRGYEIWKELDDRRLVADFLDLSD